MSDDLIQKLRNSPPREICEHGSQRVKCDHCDNERLEIENERLRELADAWCDQHQRDSAELRNLCLARDEARAELAALRARIDRGFVMAATKNGVIRTGTNAFNPGKRVALVPLDD